MVAVQYTATAQHTMTTSSAPSGRRRSAGRPTPSRIDPEEFSEVPTKTISKYDTNYWLYVECRLLQKMKRVSYFCL